MVQVLSTYVEKVRLECHPDVHSKCSYHNNIFKNITFSIYLFLLYKNYKDGKFIFHMTVQYYQ